MKPGDVVVITERVNRMATRDLVAGDWGVVIWWDDRTGRTVQNQIAVAGIGALWAVPSEALRRANCVHVVNVDEAEE
jgi:hypothetical protein